jgi:hypothetical protein
LGLCQTFTFSFEGLETLWLDSVLHKESKYRHPESQNHEGKKLWNVFFENGQIWIFAGLFSILKFCTQKQEVLSSEKVIFGISVTQRIRICIKKLKIKLT